MKLGSLFDGIGGWMLAAIRHGITPVWASEIEPFPISVTKRHFPNVVHLGDVKNIDGADIEPVHVITFGSPCQDLSIAGKREGLGGERSGLFLEAIRIIKEMREVTNGPYPRFIVWENVPGAFSSNRGLDFKTVLEEIAEAEIPMPASGKWAQSGMVRSSRADIAWRVLDAQYWGVSQRRKRIFLVADFRGRRAAEILFKPESLRGNFKESCSTWQGTPGSVAFGVGGTSETAHCLRSSASKADKPESTTCIVKTSLGFDTKDSIANSMPVLENKTPPIKTNNRLGVLAFKSGQGSKARSLGLAADVLPTLSANAGGNTVPVIYDMTHADEVMRRVKDCIVLTLNARMGTGGNQVPVIHEVYTKQSISEYKNRGVASTIASRDYKSATDLVVNPLVLDCRNIIAGEISGTLQSKQGGGYSLNYQNPIYANNTVRRLTPLECERLQGLPDGWTEGGSDSARYKAIGNGMAQPCADYVMSGIAEILKKDTGKHDSL